MPRVINESDWRIFRNLHAIALERFCQRVLSDINQISADATRTSHQRYLAIYKLIERRDRELAEAFNDLRRATALRQLAWIQSYKLLTERHRTTAPTIGEVPCSRRAIRTEPHSKNVGDRVDTWTLRAP
jgi:hypothetical protein